MFLVVQSAFFWWVALPSARRPAHAACFGLAVPMLVPLSTMCAAAPAPRGGRTACDKKRANAKAQLACVPCRVVRTLHTNTGKHCEIGKTRTGWRVATRKFDPGHWIHSARHGQAGLHLHRLA